MVQTDLCVLSVVVLSLVECVLGRNIGNNVDTLRVLEGNDGILSDLFPVPKRSTQDTTFLPTNGKISTHLAVNKRFLFLNLKLSLNVAMGGGASRRYEVVIPAHQVMGVYEAYVQAASLLKDTYPNSQNPFNLSLRYSDTDDCLGIVQAFGLMADDTHAWVMDIRKYNKESVYKGTCFPDRYFIKVGPFYEISLTYTNTADH